MRAVHEIFHAMLEGNKLRLFWVVYITTQYYGKALLIITCFNSDVNKATNPVTEVTPKLVFKLF